MTFSVIQGSRSLAGPFMEFDAQGPKIKAFAGHIPLKSPAKARKFL
jgi:hypothetical protein